MKTIDLATSATHLVTANDRHVNHFSHVSIGANKPSFRGGPTDYRLIKLIGATHSERNNALTYTPQPKLIAVAPRMASVSVVPIRSIYRMKVSQVSMSNNRLNVVTVSVSEFSGLVGSDNPVLFRRK